MADKFGMMSQAYFKGKRELLNWISTFLEMDIPKVEVLASGAHYCQLLDALYPGSIKMSKVNFGAKLQPAYVQNWKLVQVAFEKQSIQKVIPVQRLIHARFQDNLEFLQWFYQYFTSSYHGSREYNPVQRRKRCKGVSHVKPSTVQQRQSQRRENRTKKGKETLISKNTWTAKSSTKRDSSDDKVRNDILKLTEKNDALEKELKRVSSTAKAIETERDFYFKVLLKVETICKDSANADNPDIKKIMEVLYTSNDGAEQETSEDNMKVSTESNEGVYQEDLAENSMLVDEPIDD